MSTALTDEDFARRAAALRERLDAPPAESWRPDKAEFSHPRELVGVLVRFEPFADRGYGEGRCGVIRALDGQDWRVLLKTVLRSQFERLEVAPGDLVAVRYLGLREPKDGGQPYHDFRAEVEKTQPAAAADVDVAATIAAEGLCAQCGFAEPEHAAGCVPF